MPGIGQSSLIAFYLFAAFLVFITIRGELSAYVGFFVGGTSPTPSGPTSDNVKNSAPDWLSQAQSALLQGAQLAVIA